MKVYSFRFAHLHGQPGLRVGDVIVPGDMIGVMGASGAANGTHLHHDVVEGIHLKHWRLADYKSKKVIPSAEQAGRALTKKLYRVYPVVTSSFNDPDYPGGAVHSAFDSVPEDRHETKAHYVVYWPLPESGSVTYCGYDNGYGNSVIIIYEA